MAEYKGEPSIRQFICFPDQEELIPLGAARLTEFRVMIHYESGLIGNCWSRARSLPRPEDFLEFEHVLSDMSRLGWTAGHATWVAVDELGLNLEIIDHSLAEVSAWNIDAHLATTIASFAAKLSPSELAARRDELAGAARSRLQGALDSFMAALDPEILAIVGNGKSVLASRYNYFAAGDPILRRNRLQGWRSFPLAFNYRTEPLPPNTLINALSRGIDEGVPLIPIIQQRTTVGKSAARALLGCPPDAAISPWKCNLKRMGELLELLEPAFWPKSAADWTTLHIAVHGLQDLLKHADHEGLLRRWLNDIARDGWPVWSDRDALETAFIVIGETLRAAFEVGVSRTGSAMTAVRTAALESLGLKSFATVVRLARAWETAFLNEQERVVMESIAASGSEWPMPLKSFSTEERTIHGLDTAAHLYMEGRAMSHCVGSYVGACLSGNNQIWSVRTLSGERCSTLSTSFEGGRDGSVYITQHKGPENSRPDAISEAAAEALVAHLNGMRGELIDYHAWRLLANRNYKNGFDNRMELQITEAALRTAAPKLLMAVRNCRPSLVLL